MVGVKLEDVDELHRVYLELRWITYLQQLVQRDEDEGILGNREIITEAHVHLLDQQIQVMKKLKTLLEREDFYVSLHQNNQA